MKFKDQFIKKIKSDNVTTIDWILGNFCNYKCSYCFGDLNTGTFRVPKINQTIKQNINYLIKQIQNVNSNQIHFSLAGGEPTLYHDFTALTKMLNEHGTVGIITNGSRTINWWEENFKQLNKINISYHPEFSDINHIVKLIQFLLDKIEISIGIMMEPVLFEKSKHAALLLKEHFNFSNLNLQLKLLRDSFGKSIIYTQEQKEFIDSFQFKRNFSNFSIVKKSSLLILENETLPFKPKYIKDMTGTFNEFQCFAPQEFIQINQYGNVGRMSCGQRYSNIANIYDEKFTEIFSIPIEHIKCDQKICGCLGLLQCTKINPNTF
jgi:organic radical activating enzyme